MEHVLPALSRVLDKFAATNLHKIRGWPVVVSRLPTGNVGTHHEATYRDSLTGDAADSR